MRPNKSTSITFAIKAEVTDPSAKIFAFTAQKTMYGGKHIATGDAIFVFASENQGGPGLIARGVVTSAKPMAKKAGIARQTPRVSITVRSTAVAKRHFGTKRAQTFLRLERRTTGNGAQFQIVPSGDQQNHWHLGWSGKVPAQIVLTRDFKMNTIRA